LFGQTYGENRGVKSGATQAVMEEIFNRASQRHQTLAQSLGLDGAGLYEQGWNSHYNPATMESILAKVAGGGNVSLGATDNSSKGLAEREKASGKYKFRRRLNGESFFTSEGWGTPGYGKRYPAWAKQRGLDPSTGNALDTGVAGKGIWESGAKPLDLLRLGKQSGLMGGPQGFKSDASLRIDVNAPPGSVKTRLAHSGFEAVQFNRGLQMANASQVG
jgi:hypothetical protein